MAVLGLVQKPLVFSTSTPAAVGTKHDGFMIFHVALQVNNVAPIRQRCEIDISYDQDRKKLSNSPGATSSFRNNLPLILEFSSARLRCSSTFEVSNSSTRLQWQCGQKQIPPICAKPKAVRSGIGGQHRRQCTQKRRFAHYLKIGWQENGIEPPPAFS